MKFKILLSTSFIVCSFTGLAQDAKTFAITGDGAGNFAWMNIRQVDITTGKITQDVYQRNKTAFVIMDAATKKPVVNPLNGDVRFPNSSPTETMVAAAAYDKKHDKLFFTPMPLVNCAGLI